MTVLVACPVNIIKRYSLDAWINAVCNFTYEDFRVLWVDNSDDDTIWREYSSQVHIVHADVPPFATRHTRIARSMEIIRQYASRGGFDFWLNLECDVIAPPETISTMLNWWRTEYAFWYPMPTPGRGSTNGHRFTNNFCCALFPSNGLSFVNFDEAPHDRCADGWMHNIYNERRIPIAHNPPHLLDLKHIENPDPQQIVIW